MPGKFAPAPLPKRPSSSPATKAASAPPTRPSLSPKNRWSKIPLGRLPQNPGQQVREESVSLGSPLGQVIVVAEPSAVEGLSADQDQTKAYPVLCDLAWCEQVLDAEHREWLRLMFGAEWFG